MDEWFDARGCVEEIIFGDLTEEQVGNLIVPLSLADVNYLDELAEILESWPTRAAALTPDLQCRALWRVMGNPIAIGFVLNHLATDLSEGRRVIRSLGVVTESIPICIPKGELLPTGYFMLWDCVNDLLEKPELIEEAMAVLEPLLAHEDSRVQWAVLHGLGHLDHPRRAEVIAAWKAGEREEDYSAEDWDWIDQCRDGTVM